MLDIRLNQKAWGRLCSNYSSTISGYFLSYFFQHVIFPGVVIPFVGQSLTRDADGDGVRGGCGSGIGWSVSGRSLVRGSIEGSIAHLNAFMAGRPRRLRGTSPACLDGREARGPVRTPLRPRRSSTKGVGRSPSGPGCAFLLLKSFVLLVVPEPGVEPGRLAAGEFMSGLVQQRTTPRNAQLQ